MDKLWLVLLFLGIFLICSIIVKRIVINALNTAERRSTISAITAEKNDPKVYWEESGKKRNFENAEVVLSENDFFENEETEFSPTFEEEFSNLSDEETEEILKKAGIYTEESEDE